ncbi:MAG: hypothetical protein M1514_00290 [Patescibacteria group bacterium]|nr:hypothetical protein [Patescibacteria group bacterium]
MNSPEGELSEIGIERERISQAPTSIFGKANALISWTPGHQTRAPVDIVRAAIDGSSYVRSGGLSLLAEVNGGVGRRAWPKILPTFKENVIKRIFKDEEIIDGLVFVPVLGKNCEEVYYAWMPSIRSTGDDRPCVNTLCLNIF